MNENEERYMSIRKAAKLADFPNERTLRRLVEAGLCKGFFVGTSREFRMDVPATREALRELAERNASI